MKKESSTKKSPGKGKANAQANDFAGGVRGKYATEMKENGYTIRVYRRDGGFSEKRVPGESMVALEPDVQEYFPDSKSVNRALRNLISLIPAKRSSTSSKQNGVSQSKKRLNA